MAVGFRSTTTMALWTAIVAVIMLVQAQAQMSASVGTGEALRTTDWRYASVTIDAGQLQDFPFSDAKLLNLTKQLTSRSYLRVGGTAGDSLYYAMDGPPPSSPPPGYKVIITPDIIDGLCSFASATGMKVYFGINAGKGPRGNNATGDWDPTNAKSLLTYAAAKHPSCFQGWELGNEPNLWFFNWGLIITATQMVHDFQQLRTISKAINPAWELIGNDVAFQIPVVGELFPVFTDWMKDGGGELVDAVTWHWYPLESTYCPLHGWPVAATQSKAISPAVFEWDDSARSVVLDYTAKYAANGTKVFLGEMAEVSCGGTLNITDAWDGVFYFLAKLGGMAVHGHDAVMRQSLWSDRYGLISDRPQLQDFAYPDYWSVYLWRRLMSEVVLGVTTSPAIMPKTDSRRVFAHCTLTAGSQGDTSGALYPAAKGAVTVLAMNFDTSSPLTLSSFGQGLDASPRQQYVGTAAVPAGASMGDILSSHNLAINGKLVAGPADIAPQQVAAGQPLTLQPLSYAFLVFTGANAAACP